MRCPHRVRHEFGFTLIEAVVVMVITGILAAIVAVFMKVPVDSYVDTARRAYLSDMADTAMRRITRDIRLALPNSVRNPANGSDQCIELMPTRIGARYRAARDSTHLSGSDILNFTTDITQDAVSSSGTFCAGATVCDSSFEMLLPNANPPLPATQQLAVGDVVVVYNDGSTSGNAYNGINAVAIAGLAVSGTATVVTFTADTTAANTIFFRKRFPNESPANRFLVVPGGEHVVAYRCNGGSLFRYTRALSGVAWSQPATCDALVAGANAALLAENVGTCSFIYEPPGSGTGAGRFGIVSISLALSQAGDSVRLYHQVHVDNTP